MPTLQSEINKELYNKVNSFKTEFAEMNGYLKSIVEQNEKLIKLLRNAMYILAFITLCCLFAVIYGAIGKDGLHSVRDAIPKMATIPAHNDFDKWMYGHRGGAA